MNTTVV